MSQQRTTGMGLWSDADGMLKAAKILECNDSKVIQSKFYLLGHSFEVAIKGFILAKGATLNCLKDIGHDLEKAIEWAKPCGLNEHFSFTKDHTDMISLLNKYYKAKEFEYRVTGGKRYPDPILFSTMLENLLTAIKPVCIQSVKD